MKNSVVVGLDIGTTKIACFVGKQNEHGKIEIISMGKSESLGVVRGDVRNIDRTVESILAAVQEAQSRVPGQLNIRSVYVGIAGQHIKSIQHSGLITRKDAETLIRQVDIDALIDDMYKLVMKPGEEIISVFPQEYIIDNDPGFKDPIGMTGGRLESNCHIITGNVAAVRNIKKCIEMANLEVKEIILEPIASSHSVLSEEEKEAGVVLVDIGGGTTDVAIFYEGILRHTAVIPFGGNIITDDIKQGCTIMRKYAEKLKVKFGSASPLENLQNEVVGIPGVHGSSQKKIISVKALASIIEARMSEIIEFVNYEIVNSGYENKMGAGIVLTGGGSQLKHLPQLVMLRTGLDARIGLPTEHLANTNKQLENLASPMYATGIGLVLNGFQSKATAAAAAQNHLDDMNDTPDKNLKVNPGTPRENFFTKMFNKIGEKVPEFFKDED
ncbi:MAG: hypothetical protein RLZ10_602 [Bacteroidota bacterium]|jgi:cell division protein FtsA